MTEVEHVVHMDADRFWITCNGVSIAELKRSPRLFPHHVQQWMKVAMDAHISESCPWSAPPEGPSDDAA